MCPPPVALSSLATIFRWPVVNSLSICLSSATRGRLMIPPPAPSTGEDMARREAAAKKRKPDLGFQEVTVVIPTLVVLTALSAPPSMEFLCSPLDAPVEQPTYRPVTP